MKLISSSVCSFKNLKKGFKTCDVKYYTSTMNLKVWKVYRLETKFTYIYTLINTFRVKGNVELSLYSVNFIYNMFNADLRKADKKCGALNRFSLAFALDNL